MKIVKIPKKYKKVFEDFAFSWDFAYLDSLRVAMHWRNSGAPREAFVKYVATLVENFYEREINPADKRTRKRLGLGFKLGRWLWAQPIEWTIPVPCHSELQISPLTNTI